MLIGMNGFAGSGKDTFAAYLANFLGYSTYALASPIKNYINYLFGWDERCSDGVLKEEVIYTQMVDQLEFRHRMGVVHKGLADRVPYDIGSFQNFYSVFNNIFGEYDLSNPTYRQWVMSPRKAYQLFGTEVVRDNITDTFWLDAAPGSNIIWTDVRFRNEAERLLEMDGKIIRIIFPDQEIIKESEHISEKGIGDVEIFATVINDDTLKELERKAEVIASIILKDDEKLSHTI